MNKVFLVLTGKTASGKDTVMAKILSQYPQFKRIITTTSRPLRKGEIDKIDYNFISDETFRQKIANEEFLEYVEYGGNLYGTEKAQIAQAQDHSIIWRIDPSRAGQVEQFIVSSFTPTFANQLLNELLVIYLTVDDDTILKRLRMRGLPDSEINLRLNEDKLYWDRYKDVYEFVVENVPGKLDQAVSQICQIINAHLN